MGKRVFKCSELSIDHESLLALQGAGQLNLGIDNHVASQVSISSDLKPKTTTASAAFHFWNWVAFAWLGYSIYLSFTKAWWWFILGFVGLSVIWNANKKGNSENLLDAARTDRDFYEKLRSLNVWLYQMEEADAAKFKS